MAEQEARLVLEVGLSEALARRLEGLFEDAPHDASDFKAGIIAALDELERRHRGEPEQTALEIAAG